MNSCSCLYLQFPFSLQNKDSLSCSPPSVDTATLGCFTSRKAYFDSWCNLYTTNNLEAAEHYISSKPKRHTRTDPHIRARASHNTFHFHFFSSSSNPTPPILYAWSVIHARGERAQLCAATWETSLLAKGPWVQSTGPHHTRRQGAPCPGALAQLDGRLQMDWTAAAGTQSPTARERQCCFLSKAPHPAARDPPELTTVW